jgi:hypothetical protein
VINGEHIEGFLALYLKVSALDERMFKLNRRAFHWPDAKQPTKVVIIDAEAAVEHDAVVAESIKIRNDAQAKYGVHPQDFRLVGFYIKRINEGRGWTSAEHRRGRRLR